VHTLSYVVQVLILEGQIVNQLRVYVNNQNAGINMVSTVQVEARKAYFPVIRRQQVGFGGRLSDAKLGGAFSAAVRRPASRTALAWGFWLGGCLDALREGIAALRLYHDVDGQGVWWLGGALVS
jgi:hypothetical protein